jgi:hypothetical protein
VSTNDEDTCKHQVMSFRYSTALLGVAAPNHNKVGAEGSLFRTLCYSVQHDDVPRPRTTIYQVASLPMRDRERTHAYLGDPVICPFPSGSTIELKS